MKQASRRGAAGGVTAGAEAFLQSQVSLLFGLAGRSSSTEGSGGRQTRGATEALPQQDCIRNRIGLRGRAGQIRRQRFAPEVVMGAVPVTGSNE